MNSTSGLEWTVEERVEKFFIVVDALTCLGQVGWLSGGWKVEKQQTLLLFPPSPLPLCVCVCGQNNFETSGDRDEATDRDMKGKLSTNAVYLWEKIEKAFGHILHYKWMEQL